MRVVYGGTRHVPALQVGHPYHEYTATKATNRNRAFFFFPHKDLKKVGVAVSLLCLGIESAQRKKTTQIV